MINLSQYLGKYITVFKAARPRDIAVAGTYSIFGELDQDLTQPDGYEYYLRHPTGNGLPIPMYFTNAGAWRIQDEPGDPEDVVSHVKIEDYPVPHEYILTYTNDDGVLTTVRIRATKFDPVEVGDIEVDRRGLKVRMRIARVFDERIPLVWQLSSGSVPVFTISESVNISNLVNGPLVYFRPLPEPTVLPC